jgi:hypothetical protein
MKEIKIREVCKSCKGTGIYVGFAERTGFGVECNCCDGSGCNEFIHQYEDFKKRKERKDIMQVLKNNPGMCVGVSEIDNLTFDSFGGMRYSDWLKSNKFPPKSEMREFTCPAWWYQSVNYDLKPDFPGCNSFNGSFNSCRNFHNKSECWKLWDKEYGNKK